MSFSCYLQQQFFNRLRFLAERYKLPAKQQAVNVVRYYMRPYFRIIIGLIIIWLGIKSVRQVFGGYDLGLFHQFQYIPFAFLIIFTIATFLLDTTYYKLNKIIYQYAVSFIGLAFIAIVIFIIIQHNSVDNSKTVLQVSNLPGATNVLTFEFKNNNRFRVIEFDRSRQTVYYGKYDKQNDTLNILETNYTGYVKELPKTGVITADTVFWNKFDKMLVDKK
jgi:hypothetical protein